MNTTQAKLMKMAPTAVVLAIAGYGVWANQDETKSAEKGEALPTVTAAQLTPTVPAPIARDPFTLKADNRVVKPKTEPKHSQPVKPEGPTPAELAALVHGLTLNGTYVSDGKGMAIINGNVYAVGEKLQGNAHNLLVTEISDDRVRLERDQQSFVLTFAESSPGPERTSGKGSHKTDKAHNDKPHSEAPPAKPK